MNDEKFTAVLVLLIPMIISEIIQNEKITEDEATEIFYKSKVYSVLEDEKTKLWHLSQKAIYELFKEERLTGNITFPEEA